MCCHLKKLVFISLNFLVLFIYYILPLRELSWADLKMRDAETKSQVSLKEAEDPQSEQPLFLKVK